MKLNLSRATFLRLSKEIPLHHIAEVLGTSVHQLQKKYGDTHPAIKEYTHKEAVEMAQKLSKQGGNR